MAAVAFLMLGFLIGNLIGMSAESLVATLMPLLFTFFGGSAIGLSHKFDTASRKIAFLATFTLSTGCLVGVYVGVVVSEYRLLSPHSENRAECESESIPYSKYLRSYLISEAEQIDQLYAAGVIDPQVAYERLYKLINEENKEANP